ncbi:MAG: hypothetical protein FWD64_14180 [Acidobacteriaceae bacterium]|nr:hypothetical protein [Acidobacteriaceae bacterium]
MLGFDYVFSYNEVGGGGGEGGGNSKNCGFKTANRAADTDTSDAAQLSPSNILENHMMYLGEHKTFHLASIFLHQEKSVLVHLQLDARSAVGEAYIPKP